jgi:hypothetical protein
MSRYKLVGALCLLVLITPGRVPQGGGTYRFLLCRQPCTFADSTAAFAIGRLVWADSSSIHRELRLAPHRGMGFEFGGYPNGCFHYVKRQKHADSYAAIDPRNLVSMRALPTDSVRFLLYRSADAWSEAAVVAIGDTLRGRVTSRGAGVAEVDWEPDHFVAVRTGPVDLSICHR